MCCAPKPPDPYKTAAAQSGQNWSDMLNAAKLNQFSQVTPYGSQTWSGEIGSPDRTLTTSVSPEAQAYINSQTGYAQDSANAARQRIGQANAMPAFSLSGMPAVRQAGDAGQLSGGLSYAPITDGFDKGRGVQYDIGDAGTIQRSLGPQGPIQTSVGGADAATRKSVEDALYNRVTSRLNPRFQQGRTDLETRLANQGITQGSDAYTRAMSDFGQTENDAYSSAMNDAILQGGAEQSRLFGLGVTQGQFANQAQQQGFEQALGSGQFGNQAQAQYFGQQAARQQAFNAAAGQDFSQNMNAANFANQASMLKFGQNAAVQQFMNDTQNQRFAQGQATQSGDMALRNQALQEYLTGRNQPINEAAALMGQSPGVQMPQFGAPAQYNPMGVPIGDMMMQNYQGRANNYNNTMGNIFGLGGSLGAAALLCWVAREVMPERWLDMRKWMLTKAPISLFDFYVENGEEVAEFIRENPEYKNQVRAAMEAVLV